ncbi:hypothetical protein [Escherichia sp. MOD1-EC7003]|uniref:hypothetical protein n=1 Tax=Escherichia sp. MOD1-EC7003 TaxID=2093900 RepID=UPI0012FFE75C|nr:hypothetical protein [Escherichia sp. MOD1-EC7003]
MAFYLILSLILIFPFYYLSFGVALFFYAALLVTGMIAKYRSMSILRWIAVIQAACSLALVAHVYQRYGIFVTLISVIVFLFFFLLTVPAPEKEASPPAVNAPASEISLVKAVDVRTHAHFYFNSYCHKNGYDITLLPLIFDYANRATCNNALLQQLHTATATFSQLCGQILTAADTPHILPGGLYAFRDTQKHRVPYITTSPDICIYFIEIQFDFCITPKTIIYFIKFIITNCIFFFYFIFKVYFD